MALDLQRTTETHEVTNQPPPLADYDLFSANTPLVEALEREGAGDWRARCEEVGRTWGAAEVQEWGRLANENPPRLKVFDRYGHRIDEVEFHPSWHELMALSSEHEMHSLPWTSDRPGAHAARAAMYMAARAACAPGRSLVHGSECISCSLESAISSCHDGWNSTSSMRWP